MVVRLIRGESPTQSLSGRIKTQRRAERLRKRGIKARAIKTRTGATEVIILEDPKMFEAEITVGDRTKKIIGTEADIIKAKSKLVRESQRDIQRKAERVVKRQITQKVVSPTLRQKVLTKKPKPTTKLIGRVQPTAKLNIIEKARRKLKSIEQKSPGTARAIAAGTIGAATVKGAEITKAQFDLANAIVTNDAKFKIKTGEAAKNLGDSLKFFSRNPKLAGQIFKLNLQRNLAADPVGTAIDTALTVAFITQGGRLIKSKLPKTSKTISTQKLDNLAKEIDKFPKAQRLQLIKDLKRIQKKSSKDIAKLDIGIVTKLESQNIAKSLAKGKIKGEQIIITKNRLFAVKKAPTKTGKFEADIISIKSRSDKNFGLTKGVKQTVEAKFNPKTKSVEILKIKDVKVVKPSELASKFRNFKRGKTIIETKRVKVRPSKRKITQIKTIRQIELLKDINPRNIKILNNTKFDKILGRVSGKKPKNILGFFDSKTKKIVIRDNAGLNKLNPSEIKFLRKDKSILAKQGRKIVKQLKNTLDHELGHKLDLEKVGLPIFDGIKNIKTNKQFYNFANKLNKQKIIGRNINTLLKSYNKRELPLEVRAEIYKTFLQRPKLLKSKQPKLFSNIENSINKAGLRKQIKKVTTKTDLKISIKGFERKIKTILLKETKKIKVQRTKQPKKAIGFEIIRLTPKEKIRIPKKKKIEKGKQFFNELVVIGTKGQLFRVQKTATTKLKLNKPIINVKTIKGFKDQGLKLIPIKSVKQTKKIKDVIIKRTKNVSRNIIKPVPVSKIKVRLKPKIKVKQIIKAKTKPKPISKAKARPRIKVSPKIAAKPKITPISKLKLKNLLNHLSLEKLYLKNL